MVLIRLLYLITFSNYGNRYNLTRAIDEVVVRNTTTGEEQVYSNNDIAEIAIPELALQQVVPEPDQDIAAILGSTSNVIEVLGTEGDDQFILSSLTTTDLLYAVDGAEGINTINGTDQEDSINLRYTELRNIESVNVGAGDDYVYGSDYSGNVISGGDGHDDIYGRHHNDDLHGGEGNDFIRGDRGDDTLTGGLGSDNLYGDDGSDTIYGNEGDDRLYGGKGNDYLDGGAGEDRLYGNEGNNTLLGREGDDRLYGGDSNDQLEGHAGNDRLSGGDNEDILIGGEGNDDLSGDGGEDQYIFMTGSGVDEVEDDGGENTLVFLDQTKDDFMLRQSQNYGGIGGEDSVWNAFINTQGDKIYLHEDLRDYSTFNFRFADGEKLTKQEFLDYLAYSGTEKRVLDVLTSGGDGEDIYQVGLINSIGHIYDRGTDGATETIKFTDNVNTDLLTQQRVGQDLLLSWSENPETGSVIIHGFYTSDSSWSFVGADSQSIILADIPYSEFDLTDVLSSEHLYTADVGGYEIELGDIATWDDAANIYGTRSSDYIRGGEYDDVFIWPR